MFTKKHFDYLNWATQNNIGKAWKINLLGWHFTLHRAYIKNGYWRKDI